MADGRSEDPVRDDPVAEVDAAGDDDEADEGRESANSDPAGAADDAVGPGPRLRAAREARGLDRDELARELNLSPRVIRALEQDDDEQLPAATFVRGYIRSWARLVDEPVEPLLAAYEARAGRLRPTVQPTPWLESSPGGPGVVHHRPGLVMTVVTLILVIAGAAVLFGVWPESPAPATGTSGAGEEEIVPRQGPAASGSGTSGTGTSGSGTSGSGTSATGTSATGTSATGTSPRPEPGAPVPPATDAEAVASGVAAAESGVPDPEPSVDMAADSNGAEPEVADREGPAAQETEEPVTADVVTEVSADGSTTRVLAGGDAHLHLTFSGDCWVEIRDREDRVVHRDLHGSGQELDLLGRAPFRVRLGYAPAVELSYNDSRVPLAPHTRNDVASLVIGR